MSKIDSKALIKTLEEQLSQINQEFEQIVKEHDADFLRHKPGKKQWSAIECIQHLYLTNKYYLPKLEKALSKAQQAVATPKDIYKPGFFGNYLYKSMKPVNGEITKKVGTFGSINPDKKYAQTTLDVEKVCANFRKQQTEIKKLLVLAEEVGLDNGRVPSLIGPIMSFKPGDVFRFLLAHEERHLIQAKNAIPQTIA